MIRCAAWVKVRRWLQAPHSLSMQTCCAVIIYIALLITCANWVTASLASFDSGNEHRPHHPADTIEVIKPITPPSPVSARPLPPAHDVQQVSPKPIADSIARPSPPLPIDQSKRPISREKFGQQKVDRAILEKEHPRPQPPRPTASSPSGYIAKQRVVHFDLKGAPPKVEYFEQLLPLLAKAGATGILIEWEDTFPYENQHLKDAVASYAYTREEVGRILRAANTAKLDIIPLIQTFAHLEWVLKLEKYANMRDISQNPQVLCVARDDAWQLIKAMVDEVIAEHVKYAPVKHVHIGCDEVFQLGVCQAARDKMTELGGARDKYMLWHMGRVAQHVKSRLGANGTTLIWHDMIVNMNPSDFATIPNFTSIVEPVIWMYAENLDNFLPPYIWDSLRIFDHVWGASAYKGADGPMRYHMNVQHYVRNHHSWVKQMTQNAERVKDFRGMFLTGWSRYDHFAILAELLPVAMPSLLMCLAVLARGIPPTTRDPIATQYSQVNELVHCQLNPLWSGAGVAGGQGCQFPGVEAYIAIQHLRNLRDGIRMTIWSDTDPGYEYNGWLGRMNIDHRFSSPYYMDKLSGQVQSHTNQFVQLYHELNKTLTPIFHDVTITEWLYEFIWPDLSKLIEATKAMRQIKETRTFDARPLDFTREKRLMKEALDEL